MQRQSAECQLYEDNMTLAYFVQCGTTQQTVLCDLCTVHNSLIRLLMYSNDYHKLKVLNNDSISLL